MKLLHEKSCGALVFRKEPCVDGGEHIFVLMIRHVGGNHRSFPKGHVEAGETERMTAEREVFEETFVRINVTEKFRHTVYYNPRPGVRKEVVYFIAFTKQSEIRPRRGEIAEVEWVPLEDAEGLLLHENDKIVFRAAVHHIGKKLKFCDVAPKIT